MLRGGGQGVGCITYTSFTNNTQFTMSQKVPDLHVLLPGHPCKQPTAQHDA